MLTMNSQMNFSPVNVTAGIATFGKCTAVSEPLFRVNPGVPSAEALAQASVLMDCINRLTLIGAADAENGAPVWAAHYLGEQVKALIDDVGMGLRDGRGQDGE
ncbi:MAG: DUF3077 domain-containing protein [Paucimonas sp.]|jgi:hypothetical protein|nr:DUF3077 domain-containing protein [Paucimonas sp.]